MPSQSQNQTSFLSKVFSIRKDYFLIVFGLALIVVATIWRFQRNQLLAFETSNLRQTEQTEAKTATNPVNITIPDINLDLPVTEATITDGTWEISNIGGSHWDNSADPGQAGNIVIYGHNLNNLFGPIRWLEVGQEINLTNELGEVHKYKIAQTVTVDPSHVEYVQPTDTEILTIYTCIGFLDSQRFIIIAKPIEG